MATTRKNSGKGYTLTVDEPQKVSLRYYDEPDLKAGEVRVSTLYSGISAGTEMTAFTGSNPYLHKRWDLEQKLFVPGGNSMTYPMDAIGYEEVGEIVEVGRAVEHVKPGQLVWGYWGHKSSCVQTESWARDRILHRDIEPVCGIFSQIGAISLNAVLDCDMHLGETVAIFGQGVPGLIVTQLAKASGVEVIAVDRLDKRLEASKASGADHVLNSAKCDVAQEIRKLTDGRGADVCIEISGAYGALHDAIRSAAYNSRVVASGFFQSEGRGLFLGEEFHHNRIQVVCSQIFGVNPSVDHRWSMLRLNKAFMKLQAARKVDFKKLITHTFDAREGQRAFDLLRDTPNDALQVVLDFRS